MSYKLLLVDDHPILALGIKNLVESAGDFKVEHMATNGEEGLEFMASNKVDICILDYELPGMSGLEVVRKINEKGLETKIIMLSMYIDPSVVREILAMGVDGYILKNDTHNNLKDALEKVLQGKKFLSDEVSELMMANPEQEKPKAILTPREVEIVKLIAEDKTNKEIAQHLFISERTVETHRKNIMRKTHTGTVVSLLKYVREQGIIEYLT